MIKDLERSDGCPYKWYHNWVHKAIPREGTDAMDYGRYFETLVIGGSAHDEGLHELPLLKNGKKSAINIRIDEQAGYAISMLQDPECPDYMDLEMYETQVELSNKDMNIRGIADITGRLLDGRHALIDLKLTADVSSTYGAYSWGEPENMDFFQQVLYGYLYEQIYGVKPVNLLMVFDHSPNLGRKVIEIEVEDYSYDQMFDRIESFEEALLYYEENGFTKAPSKKECEDCPFVDIGCDVPFAPGKVDYIKINV
jgi:hypothetical protein